MIEIDKSKAFFKVRLLSLYSNISSHLVSLSESYLKWNKGQMGMILSLHILKSEHSYILTLLEYAIQYWIFNSDLRHHLKVAYISDFMQSLSSIDAESLSKSDLTIFTQNRKYTCNWPFSELRSSAFFSNDCTQTFRFCRHLEAAARFRSRNFLLFSSGSSLAALLRRPPVFGVCCVGWAGDAWKQHEALKKLSV